MSLGNTGQRTEIFADIAMILAALGLWRAGAPYFAIEHREKPPLLALSSLRFLAAAL